jgi:two-component system sensor histidine kinase UhpB
MRSIPLRLRLIGLVAIGLAISLAFGGVVACLNASRGVQTEMRAALLVARQAIENALAASEGEAALHEVESVIAAFNGNRHVRLHLIGRRPAAAAPALEEPIIGKVPAWFVRLLHTEPARVRLDLPIASTRGAPAAVVIETDPHNEILETWSAFGDALLVLALFCASTFGLIYVFIGSALRPLDRHDAALQAVGRGDYAAAGSIEKERLAPEFARLRTSFDAMAQRLAEADAQNRHLTQRLMTLQEEERREIARDLHDDIGPFLFAVRVDAAAVGRLVEAGRVHEIAAVVQGIADAVGHMQNHVRRMLGRLRPVGLAEFGLAEALRHLVDFWRQRHPDIDYRLDLAAVMEGFGEPLDTAIYRVAQEGLNNAVRHGQPGRIEVSVRREDAATPRILVEIADDGRGAGEGIAGEGFGLLGMAERVRALGGTFSRSGASERGGFRIRAILPGQVQLGAAPA